MMYAINSCSMRKVAAKRLNAELECPNDLTLLKYTTLHCSMNCPQCSYGLYLLTNDIVFWQVVHFSVSPADVQLSVEINQRLSCLHAYPFCETYTCISCPAFCYLHLNVFVRMVDPLPLLLHGNKI